MLGYEPGTVLVQPGVCLYNYCLLLLGQGTVCEEPHAQHDRGHH